MTWLFAEPADHADNLRKADRLVEGGRRVEFVDVIGFDARKNHNRNAGDPRIAALFAPEGPPVHHRHPKIEQDDAGIAAAAQVGQRFLAVRGRHRRKSLQLQELAHEPHKVWIVVHDEHAGSHPLTPRPRKYDRLRVRPLELRVRVKNQEFVQGRHAMWHEFLTRDSKFLNLYGVPWSRRRDRTTSS